MGRLIGLELYNFKSYRGASYIGFGTSYFTSIIGPNGSGKSNMMDAISFVLGIRSSHLRSTKLKDLIYRGRMLTGENNSGDVQEENDNEDDDDNDNDNDNTPIGGGDDDEGESPPEAYVVAIYEKDDKSILKFKRNITSTGSSIYSINGKVVTASQYSDVLKKENILIKARNFLVFQGDVEKVASQSAEDLSRLIETISGSIDYKKEYDELSEEKEKAHDETLVQNSKKRALKEDYTQYKAQCTEVDLFENLTVEKTNLITKKYLIKLYLEENEHSQIVENLKEFNQSIKGLENNQKKLDKEYKNLIGKHSKESVKTKKLEKSIEEKTQVAKGKKLALIPINAQIEQTNIKLKDYDKRIESLVGDLNRQKETVAKTERQYSDIKESFKHYLDEYQKVAPVGLGENDLMEYNQLREKFLTQGGHIESKLLDLKESMTELEYQVESLTSQKASGELRLSDLKISKQETKAKYEEIKARINESISVCDSKKKQLNSLKSQRDAILREEFQLTTEMKEILVQLNDYSASQRETAREKKLRENCLTLRRIFPGIRGLVYDLCKPSQKKYENAISTILGKNFDAIVVDTAETAQSCIDYLKKHRAGVASFIPLDSVEAKAPSPHLRSIHSGARPTLDIVEYDSVFERAIQYVCSDSIVCDNMEVAKYIKWERKIDVKAVTLDGSLIHKSGLMTGGNGKNESKRWDKAQIQSLTNKKNELKEQLEILQTRKPSDSLDMKLMDDLNLEENKLPSLNNAKADLERSLKDKDVEINHQLNLIKEFDDQLKDINASIKNFSEKYKSIELELEKVQDTVYGPFCERLGFTNGIKEYEMTQGTMLREHVKEKSRFTKQISYLENKLEFENERATEISKRVKKLEKDKSTFTEEADELEISRNTLQEEVDSLESEVEVLKEEYQTLSDQLKVYTQRSKELSDKLKDLKNEIEEKRKSAGIDEEAFDKLKMERYNTFKNCKLENVQVPLLAGSLDSIVLENEGDYDNDEVDVFEDFEIDYGQVSENDLSDDWETLEAHFNQKIVEATERMSTMNPNMKARERLQDVQQKLAEINEEFAATKEREKDIVSRFTEVKNKRYQVFTEAFQSIAKKIDPIYKELTKSNVSPLGGSAYLTLEDEEEPYLAGVKYHAMPPMKRFRDMDLLSGGEKTVAALALLFAIHSHHPSPFFVLDEVDAALDNANVAKVADYISKHSGPDFQFIVISLKNSLFERSDALVGIYREQHLNSSKILTLDLRGYPEQAQPAKTVNHATATALAAE